MKTITEFHASSLKTAAKTKTEVVSSGKTAEELPTALGEALKLEGDKLNLMLNAIELTESKSHNLKRVVVFTLAEKEAAPKGAIQKGEYYYSVEYFPPLPGEQTRQERPRGPKGRDGERGGKRGESKKGRRRAPAGHAPSDREGRSSRPESPKPPGNPSGLQIIVRPPDPNAPAPQEGERKRPRRRRRGPRGPRTPRPEGDAAAGVAAATSAESSAIPSPQESDKPRFKIVIPEKNLESPPPSQTSAEQPSPSTTDDQSSK